MAGTAPGCACNEAASGGGKALQVWQACAGLVPHSKQQLVVTCSSDKHGI